MNRLNKILDRIFPPMQHLPAGIFHYQAPPDAAFPYRLHLRIEPDGVGTMVVNASTVLHLNQTATEYAYYLIKQTPEDEVDRLMAKRYRVKKEQAHDDFHNLIDRLQTLINTPDLDPNTFLDFDRHDPYSGDIIAPYRLDCALTYRLEETESPELAPVERVRRELTTDEWKSVLDKSWNVGIPHIIFTGGEPTLRPDLNDLIAYTEKIGQVVGVLTDGLRLIDDDYRHLLLQSGLDHLMLILDPLNDESWKAVEKIMPEDIFTTVHLTITHEDLAEINSILDRLVSLNVKSLSLSVDDIKLKDTIQSVRHTAADKGLSLVWDLPVPYSHFHPVALELQDHEQPVSGAGRAWLYVEPDGDVLKAQGMPEVLGNFLTDPWEKIWNK